jgi:hypothetical protein
VLFIIFCFSASCGKWYKICLITSKYNSEIMNFKIGQKVVCILDYYNSYCRYPLKKGLIYTIEGFYKCPCGSQQVTLMESPGLTTMGCKCDQISFRRQSYYTWRFIPLVFFEEIIKFFPEVTKTSEVKNDSLQILNQSKSHGIKT